MEKRDKKRIGDLLIEVGLLTKEQLDKALVIQRQTGKRIGEVLVQEGFVREEDVIQVLEFQYGIPHVSLEKFNIDRSTYLMVPESLARRHSLIPISQKNGVLTVAMSDPLNVFAIDDIKLCTAMEVQPVIASMKEIDRAIKRYYGSQSAIRAMEDYKKEHEVLKISTDEDEIQEEDELNSAPAVKLVNSIIEQAIRNRASDVHIEPFEDHIKIRYRVDGKLSEVMRPEIGIMPALAARIKIVGGMNISERRTPQDGRISTEIDGREIDLRASVLPTIYGEKIVIRIIDKSSLIVSKDVLGFFDDDKAVFEKILMNPHGIILIAGPTGSGKSTTLYSAVNEINNPDINIITIEDPVECKIDGVNQVQVNPKAGLSFASGLRSILRQDPDVIVVGEMRDSETAEIAVRAAITGHLVLSTIHTNSAPGTVVRLIDMGVEPFMVATSLVGVIAQRLVKRVCLNCKEEHLASIDELKLLGLSGDEQIKLARGRGCSVCGKTGYKGRIGVHEVMSITKYHKELIIGGASEDELREISIKNGMKTLKENSRRLVLNGTTTISEMLRVAYSNE